jgi:Peptidase family S51
VPPVSDRRNDGVVTDSRLFVLMGSGETSPTMVDIHRDLVKRLDGDGRPTGLLLDTPYAFQENAPSISAKAQQYFAESVGLSVDVAPADAESAASGIRTADWVFSGPGSPTYALDQWRDGPVQRALQERLRAGRGMTVLASAAAVTVGAKALPVYEIYKVGATPYWLPGLGLTGHLGLDVVVIPHYDNSEGGTHDTRYCYLGERRLTVLEAELAEDGGVLGIDEHTAVIIDLDSETLEVHGRGGFTVRRAGGSSVLPSGSELTLTTLRAMLAGVSAPPSTVPSRESEDRPAPTTRTLVEITHDAESRFDVAQTERDATAMVESILDLETAIREWSADTEEDEGTDLARDVLRGLVIRLGEAATEGLRDPDEVVRPLVDPLLSLRERLRDDAAYQTADEIRDIITEAGIEVHDIDTGTEWSTAGRE